MRKRSGGSPATSARWVVLLIAIACGCFMRDPLDPHGELDHRVVGDLGDAEGAARSREAFERARQRVPQVQKGMTVTDVETALRAIVVAERRGDVKDGELPRKKLVEGLLCRYEPTPLRQRWLFGYDEGGVELVGFALEFARDDPEKEKWAVRSIDRDPTDDCPDGND